MGATPLHVSNGSPITALRNRCRRHATNGRRLEPCRVCGRGARLSAPDQQLLRYLRTQVIRKRQGNDVCVGARAGFTRSVLGAGDRTQVNRTTASQPRAGFRPCGTFAPRTQLSLSAGFHHAALPAAQRSNTMSHPNYKRGCAYLHGFEIQPHASRVTGQRIRFYTHRRPHQSLAMRTPVIAYALVAYPVRKTVGIYSADNEVAL